MMCDKCGKNPANIHVSQIVNGMKYEQNLCMECAAIMQASMFGNFANMLSGLGGMKEMSLVGAPAGSMPQQQGGTMDFEALGLKLPDLDDADLKDQDNSGREQPEEGAEELQAKLDAAVAAQEYEKAAELRDRIFLLTNEQKHEKESL